MLCDDVSVPEQFSSPGLVRFFFVRQARSQLDLAIYIDIVTFGLRGLGVLRVLKYFLVCSKAV